MKTSTTMSRPIAFACIGVIIVTLLCSCNANGSFTSIDSLIKSSQMEAIIKYDNAEKYSHGNTTFAANEVSTLDLNWIDGTINILHNGNNVIAITEHYSNPTDSTQIRWWLEGSTLHIQYAQNGCHINKNLEKQLTISLPKDFNFKKMNVDCVSADITLDSLRCTEIAFNTVSGDLKEGSLIADSMMLGTVSGDLDITALQAKAVDLNTISGDISVGKLTSDRTHLNSVSGDFHLQGVNTKCMDINTVSGDVDLGIPHNDFTLTTQGVSAEVSIKNHTITHHRHSTYRCGNGSMEITFQSVSGDLNIE